MVASILGVPRVAKRCILLQTRDFASAPNVEVLLAMMVSVQVFTVFPMFKDCYNAWEIRTRTEVWKISYLKPVYRQHCRATSCSF